MFPGGAKENANPVLHATLGDGPGGRQRSCRGEAAGAVARYNFTPDGWDDHADDSGDEGSGGASWGGAAAAAAGRRSAWERSVHLALRDAAAAAAANAGGADGAEVEPDAAAGAPLKLLREAGFDLPPAGRAAPRELTEPPFSLPWSARPAPLPGGGGGGGGTGAGSAGGRDAIDAEEVFETIRNVQDPEHPLSLEQLGVVKLAHVTVVDLRASPQPEEKDAEDEKDDGIQSGGGSGGGGGGRAALSTVDVRFTPTIPHCSMATLIGLSLRVKLLRSLPSRFKVTIRIEPGTHASEAAVNRQLDDKERVAAALENDHLRRVVDKCIGNGMGLPV